jgi:tetratricopeptide (TPR) repeat protein
MADKKVLSGKDSYTQEVDIVERARGFWDKYNLPVLYSAAGVLALLLGWFVYKTYVQQPNEEKAADLIFPAENLFEAMSLQTGFNADSINLVLKGGDGITGVLKIADNYGGTDAGNTAKYIAGACFLQNGEFENAVKYLKEYSTKATQVKSRTDVMIGDAYSAMKDNDEALSYYKKAASVNEKDEEMTSLALFREGQFEETIGKTDDAIASYQKIKDDYPKSHVAINIDKYLAKLGVFK